MIVYQILINGADASEFFNEDLPMAIFVSKSFAEEEMRNILDNASPNNIEVVEKELTLRDK